MLQYLHNKRIWVKTLLLKLLSEEFNFIEYEDYISTDDDNKSSSEDNIELILLGHPDHERKVLPSTILLSVIKNKGKPFCNIKFKKALGAEGIVVSISSTCLTDKKTASHVLDSINAPKKVKNGVIRISLGDNNKESEIRKFVKVFTKILKK